MLRTRGDIPRKRLVIARDDTREDTARNRLYSDTGISGKRINGKRRRFGGSGFTRAERRTQSDERGRNRLAKIRDVRDYRYYRSEERRVGKECKSRASR